MERDGWEGRGLGECEVKALRRFGEVGAASMERMYPNVEEAGVVEMVEGCVGSYDT